MLKLEYKPYTLDFRFDAKTSRGAISSHHIIFLKLYDTENPSIYGLGEAAPLPGLSEEKIEAVIDEIATLQEKIQKYPLPDSILDGMGLAGRLVEDGFSSLRFGLETAILDLINGGARSVFPGPFHEGQKMIPINGLIWMGEKESMLQQVDEKLNSGYHCIKIKVGGIHFKEELDLIRHVRQRNDQVIIRLDANGAFLNNEALQKLNSLAEFNIHSIEQPILPRQWEAMQLICKKSPIPIALDEELVGIWEKPQRVELLRFLKPGFLVLKPTLHGGLSSCMEWIRMAHEMGINYWLTSALESTIGLNAICQLADYLEVTGFQGLGTGKLYKNNIISPLELMKDNIRYAPGKKWEGLIL